MTLHLIGHGLFILEERDRPTGVEEARNVCIRCNAVSGGHGLRTAARRIRRKRSAERAQ